MLITVFFACLALGAVVGFLAGLLGIGGGLIIVPALVYLLHLLNISAENIMPMALATSLATILITSATAARAHHKNSNIPWPLARSILISMAVGAFFGAIIADMLSAKTLTVIFSSAVILLALYMLRSIHMVKTRIIPTLPKLRIIGTLTGTLASLMGISGGAILIPTLTYFGVPLRHAIGVATACGTVVALFGSLGYIITGLKQTHLPAWTLGYVYLPALLGLVLTSSLLAHFGVKMAARVPVDTLKKFFAIFLILVAIKMMWL